MNTDEIERLIDQLYELARTHKDEFDKYYEFANYVGVKNYCQLGWVLLNKLRK